jgi:hypothetical protein
MDFFRLSTTFYTPAEWAKLSPAQRSHILNARGIKHNISAIDAEYSDNFDDIYEQDYAKDNHTYSDADYSNLDQTTQGIGAVTVTDVTNENMFESSCRTLVPKNIYVTISQMNATPKHDEQHEESFNELDSHVGTSCVGANC